MTIFHKYDNKRTLIGTRSISTESLSEVFFYLHWQTHGSRRSKNERSSRNNGFRLRPSTRDRQPPSPPSPSPSSGTFTRESRDPSPGSATGSQRRYRNAIKIQRGKYPETGFRPGSDSKHESPESPGGSGFRTLDHDDPGSDSASQPSFSTTRSQPVVESIISDKAPT